MLSRVFPTQICSAPTLFNSIYERNGNGFAPQGLRPKRIGIGSGFVWTSTLPTDQGFETSNQ